LSLEAALRHGFYRAGDALLVLGQAALSMRLRRGKDADALLLLLLLLFREALLSSPGDRCSERHRKKSVLQTSSAQLAVTQLQVSRWLL